MSALAHLGSCRQMASRPFAVQNGDSRKTSPLRPPLAGEEAGAAAGMSEEQKLIQQVIAGESEAQTRLFETYTPRLYRIAFNVLRNKEDAEDAVQDGWCRAYSKLYTFARRSSLSTWLTRIVINSALMIRRKNRHQVYQMLDEASNDQSVRRCLVDDQATPEQACRNTEMNGLLARQIDLLPSTTRTAFVLFDVEGFTTAESTKMLGINNGALKSRVRRARRRLARNIVRLLHAGRQKTFIRKNSSAANYSSLVGPSNGEGSNDRL
jgi:RNA polymerase sigma-70 factor, ECF subfamily